MEYLFLVFLFLAIIAGEAFLDNFWWIGTLIIIYLIFSIIRQIKEVGSGFDGGELAMVLFKIAIIAGIIWFMWLL